MIHEFTAHRVGYRYATIVFRSLIETKAGMLPKNRLVLCHTTAVDHNGNCLLVSQEGVHVLFPFDALMTPTSEFLEQVEQCAKVVSLPTLRFSLSYTGGQELTWDQHMVDVPAALRFLDAAELNEVMRDRDAFVRGGHARLKR
jgi:hypothetical protein